MTEPWVGPHVLCVISLVLSFDLPDLLASKLLGLYKEFNMLHLLSFMCGNYSSILH